MCGRFTLTFPEQLKTVFPRYRFPKMAPRYNIAPAQPVLAVANAEEDAAEEMLWGMGGNINARAETVAEKPSFREAARTRRAIVFADGYYEWRAMGDGKQPYYIHRPDGAPFTFAALWGDERASSGASVRACTLLTTAASQPLQAIHDRMPVILSERARERWLQPVSLDAAAIAGILADGAYDLESYPVSLAVNKVASDDPTMIVRVEPPHQESLF